MAKEIYKWSLAYAIGRAYVRQGFRLFYSCIHVKGLNHIPEEQPVILAPNHQNALMDALAAMHGLRGVQVFMARADIFKNKKIARFLHFLKIMPVFRMRDGYENLGKNDVIFNQAVEVLRESRFLCIMPEGTHSEYRHLKPLVKGMFRLAFKYIEENPGKPAPVIIPVGLDYTSYSAYRAGLVIQYGTPIDSLEFYEEYKNNPPVAINQIRDRLSEELKKYMIHIEKLEHYNEIYFLKDLASTKKNENCLLRFEADKSFTDKINTLAEDQLKEVANVAKVIKHKLTAFQILPNHALIEPSLFKLCIQALVLFIAFPVFAVGYLFHMLPLRAPRFVMRKIEDHQFHSSVKFVISILLFPLWYLFFFVIFGIWLNSFLYALGWLFILYLTGEFAYKYFLNFKNWQSRWNRYKHKDEMKEIIENYQFIKQKINL